MKFFTHLFLLVFFSSTFTQVLAQSYNDKTIDWTVQNSDAIFEGQVMQSIGVLGDNGEYAYTKHTIKVSKVFKGNSHETIEVITLGATIDGIVQEWTNTTQFIMGDEGMFFCKYITEESLSISPLLLAYGTDGFAKYLHRAGNTIAASPSKTYQNIYQDLYLFLENSHGLQAKSIAPNSIEKRFLEMLNTSSVTANGGNDILVDFRFDSLSVTGIESVDIDIMVRSNTNGLQLGNSELFIEYTEEAFGTNTIGSGKTQITAGQLLKNESITPTVTDEEKNTIKISIPSNCGKSTVDGFTSLSESYAELLHIQMSVENVMELATLSFDGFAMDGRVLYYDEELGYCVPVDTVIVSDPAFPFAGTTIMSFNSPVTAGTGDTLFIVGTGFGVVPGKVLFPNADINNGFPRMEAEPTDIIWSDTLIKVRMPSRDQSTSNPAGSGKFEIIDALNMSTISPTDLEVRYAVRNFRNSSTGQAHRSHLFDDPKGDGKADQIMTFSVQQNVIDSSGMALDLVKMAMCLWSDNTGVQWNIGDTIPNGAFPDSTNAIRFSSGTTLLGNATATTVTTNNTCFDISDFMNQKPIFSNSEFTIILQADILNNVGNGATGWYFGMANPTGGKFDFFSVILHELGHALNHKHSIPDTKAMFWQLKPDSIRHTLSIDDIDGAIDVLTESANVLNGVSNTCSPAIAIGNMCIATSLNEVPDMIGQVKLFPNPATDDITISLEDYIGGDTRILVFNTLGQVVLEKNLGYLSFGDHQEDIAINALSPGIYYVTIAQRKMTYIGKIIKQ